MILCRLVCILIKGIPKEVVEEGRVGVGAGGGGGKLMDDCLQSL